MQPHIRDRAERILVDIMSEIAAQRYGSAFERTQRDITLKEILESHLSQFARDVQLPAAARAS